MYAKLVVGATSIIAHQAMRDIGRLITSETPSTSLLGAFSTTSSVIVDDTPAGWTYVGGTDPDDRPTIAAVGAPINYTTNTNWALAFSAPCLEGTGLKYALLTLSWRGAATNTNVNFTMTGAQSVTNQAVATNEGGRYFWASTETLGESDPVSLKVNAGATLHVIATPRHLTIVSEGRGMQAVWETTMTDVHRFLGTVPMVQMCQTTSLTGYLSAVVPTSSTTTPAGSHISTVFTITDLVTGTSYGTYGPTVGDTLNQTYFRQQSASVRLNTVGPTGAPMYQVSPVFFQLGNFGYPTQYVTGVVPIYWTAPQIGSSGDAIDINGDTYIFFNSGVTYGVAMKTQ